MLLEAEDRERALEEGAAVMRAGKAEAEKMVRHCEVRLAEMAGEEEIKMAVKTEEIDKLRRIKADLEDRLAEAAADLGSCSLLLIECYTAERVWIFI